VGRKVDSETVAPGEARGGETAAVAEKRRELSHEQKMWIVENVNRLKTRLNASDSDPFDSE
jgi:hypothetical protein